MARRFFAALLLAMAVPAAAQIGSDQLRLKTNGGLGGDSSRALGIEVYRGTSGPASPETGAPWCDTNTTPCTLKLWDGDSWEVVAPAANITTQADASSLPGTPTDGQLVYMRSCRCLWIYDSTNAWWVRLDERKEQSGADITETFGATVITAPAAAPTVTAAAGGSGTAGNHVCAYTYVNSTGGETTGAPSSATVTLGSGNLTYSFTGVTTGGSGTTTRRLYCSKAGTTSPLFWVGEIADNVTASGTSTLADSSFRYRMPETNFSGALPANWTVANNDGSGSGSGGCGSTGSSVWCQTPRIVAIAGGTTDPVLTIFRDISAYSAQAYKVRWAVKEIASYVGGNNDAGPDDMAMGGLQSGTAAGSIRHSTCQTGALPLSASNVPLVGITSRSSAGGTATSCGSSSQVAGKPTDLPIYLVAESTGSSLYRSNIWYGKHAAGPTAGLTPGTGTGESSYAQGFFTAGAQPTHWSMPMISTGLGYAIEFDSWSLTQE